MKGEEGVAASVVLVNLIHSNESVRSNRFVLLYRFFQVNGQNCSQFGNWRCILCPFFCRYNEICLYKYCRVYYVSLKKKKSIVVTSWLCKGIDKLF